MPSLDFNPSTISISDAELILACLPIGPAALRRLLENTTAPKILANPPEQLKDWQRLVNPATLKKQLEKLSVRFVPSKRVSPSLLDLSDAPVGLFSKGPLDISALFNGVAIVGTRRQTEYGKKFAYDLAFYLAERAIPVISGLALGIDAAAHQGALDANGPTVGVLGNGIDIVYPPENRELFDAVSRRGLILSEYPLGRQPDRTSFPRRNRIIAALSGAVVVIESDLTGGAMITAEITRKLGRRLFALPGRIDQPTSRGPHKLIQEGASLITSPEDFYRQLTNLPSLAQEELFAQDSKGSPAAKKSPGKKASTPRPKTVLPPELSLLSEGGALSPDEISLRTHTPISKLSPMLLQLEMDGSITKRLDGKYEVI